MREEAQAELIAKEKAFNSRLLTDKEERTVRKRALREQRELQRQINEMDQMERGRLLEANRLMDQGRFDEISFDTCSRHNDDEYYGIIHMTTQYTHNDLMKFLLILVSHVSDVMFIITQYNIHISTPHNYQHTIIFDEISFDTGE